MSARVCQATLREYRELVEQLYRCLRGSDTNAFSHELIFRIIKADEELQAMLAQLIEQRSRRERFARLREKAEEKQQSLLIFAARMQKAEANLATLIERAQEALERADAAAKSGRRPTLSQVLEYAERVSYSNAAPCGNAALESAAKDRFRGGWGTPAPQQHMLAVSKFALMQRDRAAPAGEAAAPEPSPADAAPSAKRARLNAPAFKTKSIALQPPNVAKQSVTLDLNPDDEDDSD